MNTTGKFCVLISISHTCKLCYWVDECYVDTQSTEPIYFQAKRDRQS